MGGSAGAGGSGHSEASTFMSYAGPVFPLTLAEENGSITAQREHHPGLCPLDAGVAEQRGDARRPDLADGGGAAGGAGAV